MVAVKFVEDAEDDYVGLEVARYRSVQGGFVVFDGAETLTELEAGHTSPVFHFVRFSPDGSKLVSGSYDDCSRH